MEFNASLPRASGGMADTMDLCATSTAIEKRQDDWDCRKISYAPVLGRLSKRVETGKPDAEHSITGKSD